MNNRRLLAAVVVTHFLLSLPAQAQTATQCYSRTYSTEHLEKHPHQTVTSVTLSLYTGENAPQQEFWIWITRRTDKIPLYTGGSCATKSDRGNTILSCTVDCDGGGFGVESRKKDAVLVHLAPPFGFGRLVLGASCGEEIDPANFTLAPGTDDKTFSLDAVPHSACKSMEANLPTGTDE